MTTIQKIMLITVFLLLPAMNCFGQETLSREQEREIKVSGKYYFAECAAFDEAVAKECALRDLTQTVIAKMLQQAIRSEKPEEMQKIIEMRANMAQLPTIGRVQILAWVSKDSIFLQNEANITPEPMPEPASTSTPEPEPMPELSVQIPEPVTTPPSIDHISNIANPIIQDLSASETLAQFTRKADSWARQGRLVYGNRKMAFARPDNCHIAVFSSSGTLIALLGEGNMSRANLMTGETVPDPEQHYNKDRLIWIQLN